MDAIASLLDGPRARGAFLLRAELDPPWAMRIQDGEPLSLVTLVQGSAWVAANGAAHRELAPGDVVIALGPHPYEIGDAPATPAQVIVHPGQVCASPSGERLDLAIDPATRNWSAKSHGYTGVRTWGNTTAGSTQLLIGTYRSRSIVGQRLTSALPALAVLPGFARESSLFTLLAEEIAKEGSGQDVVLDRLLDLLLVAALRKWFSQPEAAAPRWYRAGDDDAIGPVVRMLVDHPERSWTVVSLADTAGMSRAAFARRFTELVGEPPMTFLAGWRLAMAADLLRDTDATLEAVARRVGYGSPFALSTAFKRVHGISPQEHRRFAVASP